MMELQRELDSDEDDGATKPDPKGKAKTPDLVLEEGLRILSEVIVLQPASMPPLPPAGRSMGMPQWLQVLSAGSRRSSTTSRCSGKGLRTGFLAVRFSMSGTTFARGWPIAAAAGMTSVSHPVQDWTTR